MSISNMTDTIGRGIGPYLGGLFIAFFSFMLFPLNLNITLMIGVLFWIPCGALFLIALRTYLDDKNDILKTLQERAEKAKTELKEKEST